MIFVITTFSLFYFTYLYNFLYVNEFTSDTGGLAFPRAIYQTMTGLYFAEVCLIGLFFITPGARPQGIVMVVVLVITALYQIQLASMFDPLITYLPIDIQEELLSKVEEQNLDEGRKPDEEAEFQSQREPKVAFGDMATSSDTPPSLPKPEFQSPESSRSAGKPEEDEEDRTEELDDTNMNPAEQTESRWRPSFRTHVKQMSEKINIPGLTKKRMKDEDDDDGNVDTSLERKFTHELTHEELTAIAFQHEALRARPPILWIPEDELGIARDEIHHTKLESGDEIQITCVGAKLDENGKILWSKNPPDYVYIPTL